MMKLGGFKASLNIFNSKRLSKENDEFEPGLSIVGAYRINRDEYFGNDRVYEPPKRLTPSMVKLPVSQTPSIVKLPESQTPSLVRLPESQSSSSIRPSKSSGDVTKPNNIPANLRYSNPTISLDPRGEEEREPRNSRNGKTNVVNTKQEKEQAKVRKKQLAEQKAREKLAAKERAKQEKLAKAREKKEAKEKSNREKKEKKIKSPVAQPLSTSSTSTTTVVTQQRAANPLAQGPTYLTNTLESSISKSSGPPPYSAVPNTVLRPDPVPKIPGSAKYMAPKPEPKETNGTNDIIFSEPVDTGSWDMVTHHRQQVSKTTTTTEVQNKQRKLDLNYNLYDKDNSEA